MTSPRALRLSRTFAITFLLLIAQITWSQSIPAQAQTPTPNTASAQDTAAASTVQDENGDLRIAPGDLLDIRVFGVPEMNQEVRVSGNGDVMISLLGLVRIAGLTNYAAQAALEARLKEAGLLKDPHITVTTKEYSTQGITILGEVQKPGIYPLLGSRRLFDLISIAGGTTPRAGRQITITHRDQPDKPLKVQLNTIKENTSTENVEVDPGDTVFVSKAGVIYVVGDVLRPSGFLMDNDGRMTVLQAIALAGGTNSTAALNGARIIRRTPNGLQEVPIPLKPLLQAKAQDISLENEDILFVPKSKAKSSAKRGLESIVQMTTGLVLAARY